MLVWIRHESFSAERASICVLETGWRLSTTSCRNSKRPSPSIQLLLVSLAHVRVLAASPAAPPSFLGSCFQPLCLPSPRPGLRSGLALSGSGPRRAPLSFVFVLAALLAVRFAAWSLDAGVGVPFFVSEFKCHMLEDAAISFNDSGGYESKFWFAACEFDQNGYKLESLVARLISQGSSRSLD